MKCKECKSAELAASTPAIGNYYRCPFDHESHSGNEQCRVEKKSK